MNKNLFRRGLAAYRALVGLAISGFALASCATPVIPAARTPDLGRIPDGRYLGAYDASIVKAGVAVEVAGGRMTRIEILSHDCSPIGRKAEAIVARVLEAQSLDVDIVTGATGSSRTLLKALEAALLEGEP